MIVTFPNIPLFYSGVLGAMQLNALKNATDYLLGISHGPFTASWCCEDNDTQTNETSYNTRYTFYGYSPKQTLYYHIYAKVAGGGTHYLILQYYGDDSSWHTILTITGTNADWALYNGTVDLSSETYMTAGYIYRFRIQTKSSSSGVTAYHQVWYLAMRRPFGSWTAPPTFTNETISSAAHFNTLRSDAIALYDYLPEVWPMLHMPTRTSLEKDTYTLYASACYRYRPDSLVIKVRCRYAYAPWRWLVRFYSTPSTSAQIYESNTISASGDTPTWSSAEINLTSGDAAAALAAAGITLTLGNIYKIRVYAKKVGSDQAAAIQGVGLYRRNASRVGGGNWSVVSSFAEGDTNLGATKFNALRANLLELYSGAEMLWNDMPLLMYRTSGELGFGQSGIFARRYLVYEKEPGEEAAVLRYGPNLSEAHQLTSEDGLHTFDLRSMPIAPGGFFWIQDCRFAVLSNLALEGKP